MNKNGTFEGESGIYKFILKWYLILDLNAFYLRDCQKKNIIIIIIIILVYDLLFSINLKNCKNNKIVAQIEWASF